MDKTYTVYRFTFPNGKLYFGITSAAKPEHRWGRGKNYNHLVRNAIDKYGWENITKDVVADNLIQEQAESMEVQLIKEHNTTDPTFGYNIAEGGKSCSGWRVSEETREKLRTYATNRPATHCGRISKALKGRQFTEEHRRNISIHRTGIKHTEEAKEKIRYASSHRTPEAIENHRKGLLGHSVSESTRKKISEAHKGVPKPEWLKEKWREAALNRTPEATEKLARSRSKPILCVNTNKLYRTMLCAKEGEGVSEERISYSCKNNVPVKGLQFYQFPIGTLVEDIVKEHPEYIIY